METENLKRRCTYAREQLEGIPPGRKRRRSNRKSGWAGARPGRAGPAGTPPWPPGAAGTRCVFS